MNTGEQYAVDLIAGGTRLSGHAGDILRLRAALRFFPADTDAGKYLRQIIRAGMRERLERQTRLQIKWGTCISRRRARALQRSNNRCNQPDPSRWLTREKYVTGKG